MASNDTNKMLQTRLNSPAAALPPITKGTNATMQNTISTKYSGK